MRLYNLRRCKVAILHAHTAGHQLGWLGVRASQCTRRRRERPILCKFRLTDRNDVSATKNTYADAVKAGLGTSSTSAPTSQGHPIIQVCSISPSSSASHSQVSSSPHVIIDISNAEKRAAIVEEKPGAVRRRIDEALSDHEATKDIKCWGISRNP